MNSRKFPRLAAFFVLAGLPLVLLAASQTVHYVDETFKFYVSPAKVFFLYGPWGEDPVTVDRDVAGAWGTAAANGVFTVYQKRDELHFAVFSRETGDKNIEGILRQTLPEEGILKYAVVTVDGAKATAKFVFDTDYFMVYQFEKVGRAKLVRQGTLGKR